MRKYRTACAPEFRQPLVRMAQAGGRTGFVARHLAGTPAATVARVNLSPGRCQRRRCCLKDMSGKNGANATLQYSSRQIRVTMSYEKN